VLAIHRRLPSAVPCAQRRITRRGWRPRTDRSLTGQAAEPLASDAVR
jgi:hypothetical protein